MARRSKFKIVKPSQHTTHSNQGQASQSRPRKRADTKKRVCNCTPACRKALTLRTRRVHYARLTESELDEKQSSDSLSDTDSLEFLEVSSAQEQGSAESTDSDSELGLPAAAVQGEGNLHISDINT